ncbi:hypothetical protein JAAARDRAFT_193384 [Jaapia argillacea MUCL 33604]|uniref:C2H2-type domain-containing protein n=1 Tax=Jaapia argillacea MUCL 33604 TaxID=933084 RepID=A0A067PVM2_9AGAM|nr:hypothetical protein JAAARDRAFT_193384 [Jaapia argillacea MUCL 33604]
MAATSQPIALPSSANEDISMISGSFTGNSSGSFNPASYTRHVLGSPLSWRAGSFGSRFYPGVSPGQLLGPLDPTEFKCMKMSSSVESDRGSMLNAFNIHEREDELCRNYTCCGLNLTDLHALLEHFEECHVVVVDPYSQPHLQVKQQLNAQGQPISYYPDPTAVAAQFQQQHVQQQAQLHHAQQQQATQHQNQQQHQNQPSHHQNLGQHHLQNAQAHQYHAGPFDPDDMELDLDSSSPSSGAPTPPDTPLSTPLSAYPSPSPTPVQQHPHLLIPSQIHPHSNSPSPISAFDTTTVLPTSRGVVGHSGLSIKTHGFPLSRRGSAQNSSHSHLSTAGTRLGAEDAFNGYSPYGEYNTNGLELGGDNGSNGVTDVCVPPALLFSASTTPVSTPSGSRVGSPAPGSTFFPGAASSSRTSSPTSGSSKSHLSSSSTVASSSGASTSKSSGKASSSKSQPQASTTLSRPASSLLLSKPFRCPKPNCNKSYKQANGLKYHMTHGSCNFGPAKELGEVQAVLREKVQEKQLQAGYGSGTMNIASPSEAGMSSMSAMTAAGAGISGVGELSEREMMEVEREAERRLRPFACGVGECQRRYKNMNGLRYHYQHSGDHGAIGLALLASGQHECLRNAHGRGRDGSRDSSRVSTPRVPSPPSNSNSNGNSPTTTTPPAHALSHSHYPAYQQYTPPATAQSQNQSSSTQSQQQQYQQYQGQWTNGAMVLPYVLPQGQGYSS